MQVHTLDFNDFYESNYTLIGIHTTLEDYRMAYLLNQELKIQFKKANFTLNTTSKNQEANFAIYEYSDENLDVNWFLIANSYKNKKSMVEKNQLFNTEIITYLIPEKKKIDFFIKIEDSNPNGLLIDTTIEKINKINQVITCYLVQTEQLKSKKALIF